MSTENKPKPKQKRARRYSSKYWKCGYEFHPKRGELGLIKAALKLWELKHPEAI